MPLTKQQFLELEGNIKMLWKAYHENQNTYIDPVYHKITRKAGQFTDFTIGAPGRMTKWNGSVAYDKFEKGYTKKYEVEKYTTGLQVERDMYEDEEFERLKPYITNMGFGVTKTLRYEGVQLFEKAFSTDILGPDGKSLCASDHKTTPNADAQSNLGTNELTYAGLQATKLAMEGLLDDRGDKMLIEGNFVIAGSNQRDNLQKLFGSDREAYVGDNTKNIYKDTKFYIHPLISGNKWFMANEELLKGGSGLNCWIRRDPTLIERDGSTAAGDFNTEILSWKSVGRWDFGWTNFFCIFGNNV